MKTELDIGIDIDGQLNVFIARQTMAPYENGNYIKLSNLSNETVTLKIYEGICIQNERNHLLKTIELHNARNGLFMIQMKLMIKDDKLIVRVMSDDIIMDDLECCIEPEVWINNKCDEDDNVRELFNARNNFIEFVDNAYEFLNDIDVKKQIDKILVTKDDNIYYDLMMRKLDEAMKVIELCTDVTKDEYTLMLDEIVSIVNPFIARIQCIVKREPI